MKFTAFIFARSGSKGLPNKNIIDFCGKPLIAWAIEQAKSVSYIDEVIVSTDSHEIANIAKSYGASIPFLRPSHLASDSSPEWESWKHALDFYNKNNGHFPDAMVSIPTTSPLRLPIDIENCINEYKNNTADCVISVTESRRNPFFNMVKIDDFGFASLVCSGIFDPITRRQDAPKIYDVTTVCYVLSPSFVMSNNSIFDGKILINEIPSDRAIDIDDLLDFRIAEILMQNRKTNEKT